MPTALKIIPASLSVAAAFGWGTSDFLGGYFARRLNTFLFTTIAHASGTSLLVIIALAMHSALPSGTSILWGLSAGVLGGTALAIYYQALSVGKMGLTAPLVAVLAAAIPTLFSLITEGLPSSTQLAGFVLAGIGIWLVSRSDAEGRPEGIGMAVLAGFGFAGFFLCVRQAGSASALWIAACSRGASFVVTGVILLALRASGKLTLPHLDRRSVAGGMLAGFLDSSGSVLFIRASQAGRLDTAVVLTSLYPAVTVLLARLFLRERLTPWKTAGIFAALVAVPLVAM